MVPQNTDMNAFFGLHPNLVKEFQGVPSKKCFLGPETIAVKHEEAIAAIGKNGYYIAGGNIGITENY